MKKIGFLTSVVLVFALVFGCFGSVGVSAASAGLNKKSITLKIGKTYTLKLVKINKKAKWSTSNKKVATISQKGKVTAKKAGKAVISAKVGKKTYKCTVKVPAIKVKSITLSRKTLKIKAGVSYTLKATVAPKNASNKGLKWTSTKAAVASVSKNGKVTAKKVGNATVKATAVDGSKKSASCKVTVLSSAGNLPTIKKEPVGKPSTGLQKQFDSVVNVIAKNGKKFADGTKYLGQTDYTVVEDGLDHVFYGIYYDDKQKALKLVCWYYYQDYQDDKGVFITVRRNDSATAEVCGYIDFAGDDSYEYGMYGDISLKTYTKSTVVDFSVYDYLSSKNGVRIDNDEAELYRDIADQCTTDTLAYVTSILKPYGLSLADIGFVKYDGATDKPVTKDFNQQFNDIASCITQSGEEVGRINDQYRFDVLNCIKPEDLEFSGSTKYLRKMDYEPSDENTLYIVYGLFYVEGENAQDDMLISASMHVNKDGSQKGAFVTICRDNPDYFDVWGYYDLDGDNKADIDMIGEIEPKALAKAAEIEFLITDYRTDEDGTELSEADAVPYIEMAVQCTDGALQSAEAVLKPYSLGIAGLGFEKYTISAEDSGKDDPGKEDPVKEDPAKEDPEKTPEEKFRQSFDDLVKKIDQNGFMVQNDDTKYLGRVVDSPTDGTLSYILYGIYYEAEQEDIKLMTEYNSKNGDRKTVYITINRDDPSECETEVYIDLGGDEAFEYAMFSTIESKSFTKSTILDFSVYDYQKDEEGTLLSSEEASTYSTIATLSIADTLGTLQEVLIQNGTSLSDLGFENY